MTATTFRAAYGVLQRHAETRRNQREPNIDDLLNIVTESISAYQVCRERIEAVEMALEQALGGLGIEPTGAADDLNGPAEAARPQPPVRAPSLTDMDDDIPF
ncbi:exodeoxyribonuclease VII small subunit [Caldimonas tepidiphila]|uniref:exodeoxyribonuclease VII small subunit n=1 Tax=Caldimonas tepidiphila TaxID=2315841 RepID=UPI001472C9F4|nr:exodeoxyribonuclease VII small subunit [Caldimonas tepidiphila]